MTIQSKYRSNRNVVFSCIYHVIWCVKYRRRFLVGKVATRLKEICLQVARDCRFEIQEMECDGDHIPILIDVDPQFGIHKAVQRMKGRSSRLMRDEFTFLRARLPRLWTNSYFVATCGGAPLSVIKQYIETQEIRSK